MKRELWVPLDVVLWSPIFCCGHTCNLSFDGPFIFDAPDSVGMASAPLPL
jgi:hypothetical protein